MRCYAEFGVANFWFYVCCFQNLLCVCVFLKLTDVGGYAGDAAHAVGAVALLSNTGFRVLGSSWI